MKDLINKFVFKNIDLVIYIIIFLYFFYKFTSYKSFFYLYVNEWAFSETLINYSGGFVRRGVIGEFFSKISGNEYKLYYVSSFIFYLASFVHLVYFFILKSKNFSYLNRFVLFFSPFGFYYLSSNLNFFFGRKDLLILNFLIIFSSKKLRVFKYQILNFLIFGTLLTLAYEMFLFFLPLFWKLINDKTKKHKYIKIASFNYLALLNISLITLFSSPKNFEYLCSNIETKRIQMSLDNLNCWGAPNYLNNKNKSVWINEVIDGLNFSSNYILWAISIALLILFINYFVFFDNSYKYSIGILFVLFFIAQDYGRWMFLIFATTFVLGEERKSAETLILKYKLTSYLLLFSGLILDIPVYLFQEKIFFRF